MTRLTTLDSGLRVVTIAMPGLETASVALFADCGSRHEPAPVAGLAHLFEHMVFKGAGGRSAREISETIEDVGGDLNAATDRDSTYFSASVMGEHVPLAIELIADLVQRPHFTAEELEREKDVIRQELAEVLDTPSDLIFDELWSAAFVDQPLGRPVLGDEAGIAGASLADLERWRNERYRGGDLILAAAGDVDHDLVVEAAGARFDRLAPGRAPTAAQARFTGGTRVSRTPSEQAQISFAFEAPAELDQDYYAARLFADIAGGGASSRLFQQLREDRGLAYTVSASVQSYSDCGIFYVHAASGRRDSAIVARLISEVLEETARDVDQRELDRVRRRARAALLMYLETPWGQASYAARQLAVHGRLVEPAELVARFDSVTLDDVREAGARILSGARAQASIGVPSVRAA